MDVAVVLDSPDERWPSMDLAGEMLLAQWNSMPREVRATPLVLNIPALTRRFPGAAPSRRALNVDRALVRYVAYPLRAVLARRGARMFHIVDHSYAQIVHALPAARAGVYCHDLDAIRSTLEASGGAPECERPSAPPWQRALGHVLRAALRSAGVVFYSTQGIGDALERHGIVARSRLVHAPYGVSPEFAPMEAIRGDGIPDLPNAPYVLHVGSGIPRKRLDVLFDVFARLRARRADLRLVQQGANLSAAQRAHIERLGIGSALLQPPRLARTALARLYRHASVVLVTSDAEGFGLPVAEALACGATVVASDIPALREVGGGAVVYAPAGDVEAWHSIVERVLADPGSAPGVEARLARAATFSWERHARTILNAYKELHERERGAA